MVTSDRDEIGGKINIICDPRQLEQKAKDEVSDDKVKKSTSIITSIEDCIKSIEEYFKAGFTRVYMHSTSPDDKSGFMALNKTLIEPLLGWRFITVEKVGSHHVVSLTNEGRDALRFLNV